MTTHYVIGDIGGTNLRFALVEIEKLNYKILFEEKYKTKEVIIFTDILNLFLTHCVDKFKILPTKSVICAAGPKSRNIIKLTNSNLKISQKNIFKKTAIEDLNLFNDFEIIPYSISLLNKKEIIQIKEGKTSILNNKIVIGPGTGLGVTTTEIKNKKLISKNEELGHTIFKQKNESDKKLISFLKKEYKLKKFEWEDILSGRGLERIYNYLQKTKYKKEKENLKNIQISKSRKTNKCSKETFEIFIKYLARFSREILIKNKSDSLYLSGGILLKNSNFDKKLFIKEFISNNDKLKDVPIYHIKTDDAGLLGCIGFIQSQN